MRKMTILCDTNPMCYGSSTAALCILSRLDAHVHAIAMDSSMEVMTSSPHVDHVIELDVKDPNSLRAVDLEQYDAALVVSNQSNVAYYHERGLPVFYVDILYWFGRSKRQPVWSFAQQTFVQNFPGVAARIEQAPRPPQLVGPLIEPPAAAQTSGSPEGTFVNLGGGRSRWVIPGENTWFSQQVVRWLSQARERLPQPITIATGAQAAHVARQVIPPDMDIHVVTLPHDRCLEHIRRAKCYITTPGLNAVFEGIALGQSALFLPPQNATQVLQLRRYEEAGLVAPGLNLDVLDADFTMAHLHDEARLTPAVLESLERLRARADTAARVVRHLTDQLSTSKARGIKQRQFMRQLGPPGGQQVAQAIEQWWGQA